MTGKQRIETALRMEQPDCVGTFEWFIGETVGEALTGSKDPIYIIQ